MGRGAEITQGIINRIQTITETTTTRIVAGGQVLVNLGSTGTRRLGRDISGAAQSVREIIGRSVFSAADLVITRVKSALLTWDTFRPDYTFWDRFRRGKVKGYTLGSLYARRIEKVFSSWVFGSGFEIHTVSNDKYTDKILFDYIRSLTETGEAEQYDAHDALVPSIFEDSLGLGDQFIIMNTDATVVIPSPDTVKWNLNPLDYRLTDSVEIFKKTEKFSITDTYTPFNRVVVIKPHNRQQPISRTVYDNLFAPDIPILHVTHARGRNEIYGHPIHEPLRPLYDELDSVMFKQIDGAKLLGNPILAIEGLEDLRAVKTANAPTSTENFTDPEGRIVNRQQLVIDSNSVLLIGKGGSGKFIAPPTGFTRDTATTVKGLFLLLLNHIGIPEFIWGGEQSSARATSETQMTQWTHDVESIQHNVGAWLGTLCKLYLRALRFTDPKVKADEDLVISWRPLVAIDQNILLKNLQFALDHALITGPTTLKLLQLPDIDDPEKEFAAAQKEMQKRASDALAANPDPGAKPGSSSRGDVAKPGPNK